MPLAPFLLDIVACPSTGMPLKPAPPALLERLNAAIDKGKLKDEDGRVVGPRLQTALVREDSSAAYPVWENLPRLLPGAAIPLDQIS